MSVIFEVIQRKQTLKKNIKIVKKIITSKNVKKITNFLNVTRAHKAKDKFFLHQKEH